MNGSKNFLIVDDDTRFLGFLAQGLRNRGYIVTAATSVQEAKDALAANNFSLVCSDIRMTDGTGFELLDYIRAAFTDLPVIMMSSSLTQADRLQTRIARVGCVEKTDSNLLNVITNYRK